MSEEETEKKLEDLTKEELIYEVKRLKSASSSTPQLIFSGETTSDSIFNDDFYKQREILFNGSYEIYAIKNEHSGYKYPDHQFSKNTYTHLKGEPIPGHIKPNIVELLGDEVDVFRYLCGISYDGYCTYLCKEDGVCDHFRPVRLARAKKEILPPLTEEFIVKIHKYYEHLWQTGWSYYRPDGTYVTTGHPTLDDVRKKYGL
jgi:hypothetical protein